MPSYSGVWTLVAQMQAEAAGNWPKPPFQGEMYAWGDNANGQLGLNDTVKRSSPVQVGSLATWAQLAIGSTHTIATKADGTLWSWGSSNQGQLGLNDTVNRSSPVQVGALTTWYQVASGSAFTLATKTDGTLWAWGYNGNGQLGLGDAGALTKRSSPVQVGALTTWYQVAAGSAFTLATKTDGTLWSWGNNSNGQLGLNDTVGRSSPVQIGALTTWYEFSAGSDFSVAIKTDGTLWSWGNNGFGQLGQNNTTYRSSPVQIGALTNWSRISAGAGKFCLAIKTDGTLWSWGYNDFGTLGQNDTVRRSSPVQVGSLTNWYQVAAGKYHCIATKADGTLWSWGVGGNGQLGLGNTTYRSSPVQVGALTTWSRLAKMPMSDSSLALKTT